MADTTDTITIAYTTAPSSAGSSTPLGFTQTIASQTIASTGNEVIELNRTITFNVSNLLLPITFPYASIQCYVFYSTQNLSFKTNSTGSPDNQFTIYANIPYFFFVNGAAPNVFTYDVTALYVSNSSLSATADLTIRVLLDL